MNEKRITLKLNPEIYKKVKIKAIAKDESVNTYIETLIAENVDDVDLSALIN